MTDLKRCIKLTNIYFFINLTIYKATCSIQDSKGATKNPEINQLFKYFIIYPLINDY